MDEDLLAADEGLAEVAEDNALLTLADILRPDVNLAELMDDAQRNEIGHEVIRDVEIDELSREEWLEKYERWLDIAMQNRGNKSFPWKDASNVKYPLLTVASVQFQARAYPAIVDGSNLVKGRVLGPDPSGDKRKRAERMAQHMTWQLLYRMPNWEEETDKLLLQLPIVGTVFRKNYHDSIANANRSEVVTAPDFIINYWAKSLESAPRYTHVLNYYPYEVREKVAAGLWLDISVESDEEGNVDDSEGLVEFYEQHRCIDLDGDGYPEHYVVTTNKQGDVARIVPCFGEDEVTVMSDSFPKTIKLTELTQTGALEEVLALIPDLRVVRIERRQYFTKYGFIPSPDGSFYDIGFGALLDDITSAIDTTMNQMLDAGSLQNAQGGFIGSGVNIRSGDKPFRLGEWKRVDVTGGDLRSNIVPLSLPGPSGVLFSLLETLIAAAKEITSVSDVMVGEGTANQPATTTLALIEQGQKVMSAIFKRIHRSFGQDLRILRRLNRDYLDDEEYFNLNDPEPQMGPDGQPMLGPDGQPVVDDVAMIGRQDYADDDLDVIPTSDPNTVSDMQKLARAQALMGFNGDPLVNQEEIRRRFFEAIGERDIKKLMEVPPPAPDPKGLVEAGKLELEKEKIANDKPLKEARAAADNMTAARTAAELGLYNDATTLAARAVGQVEGVANEPIVGPGDVPGMGGQPVDAGLPAIPEGPAAIPDGGMGIGGDELPGDAGASGPVGPAPSDQF